MLDYEVTKLVGARQKKLTPKQDLFARSYVLDCNAKKAAIKAGYSESYAAQTGYKLLSHPQVACRVEELREDLRKKHEATVDNIVEQYRRIAMTSPTALLVVDAETGLRRYKLPEELTPEEQALIQGFTLHKRSYNDKEGNTHIEQSISYKTTNRKDALDSLSRIQGLFRDSVQHDHEHTHKIKDLFDFIAAHPERSELSAIVDAKRKGVTLEGETAPLTDDQLLIGDS